MTTYHTPHDTDGVPAPSDYELATLDSHVRPSTFNRFCTQWKIRQDREQFHAYALSRTPREQWTWDGLAVLWMEFNSWIGVAITQAEDARDLANTQQDALI